MLARPRPARRSPRSPRAFGALVTAALAIGLLLARIALASHYLLVPHSLCEHGELTHAAAVPTLETNAQDERLDASPATAEADHDHCDADALHHRPHALHPPILASTLLAILDLPAPSPGAEQRPIPILHLAPKSSPPVT